MPDRRMPVVVFNSKDALQHDVLRDRGVGELDLVHLVPTRADFHEAVRRGLGWGMLPEPQLLPDLRAGRLVTLGGRTHHDVHLYWQRWRMESAVLSDLTAAVEAAAAAALR